MLNYDEHYHSVSVCRKVTLIICLDYWMPKDVILWLKLLEEGLIE